MTYLPEPPFRWGQAEATLCSRTLSEIGFFPFRVLLPPAPYGCFLEALLYKNTSTQILSGSASGEMEVIEPENSDKNSDCG